MTTHNHIDDIFRKGLADYSEQPPADLWLKVEKKVRFKKWLSKLFIFSAAFIILFLISLIAFKYVNKPTAPEIILNNINDSNIDFPDKLNETLPITKEPEEKSITAEQIAENKKEAHIKCIEDEAAVISDKKDNFSAENIMSYEDIAPKEKETEKLNTLSEIHIEALKKRITEKETEIGKRIEAALSKEKDENIIKDENEITIEKPFVSDTSSLTDNRELIADTSEKTPEIKDNDNYKPARKAGLKASYEALVFVMPSYAGKKLSGWSQQDIDFRENNETNHLFVNYGLAFRIFLKNLYLQSGAILSQAGEKNKYEDKHLKQIDTSSSHYNVYTVTYPDTQNPNNTIISFDSTWVHVSDSVFAEVNLKKINTIKYIEIPLNIGYLFNTGNHSIGINGGVSCGLLTMADMSIVDKDSYEIKNYTEKDKIFTRTLWSYNISLEYAYALSGNTSLFMQAAYRENIKNTFNGISLQQKYYFYESKFGIILKF